ncbi:UDP-N-acetylglucosamine 1-carboxyvinyltransferase [Thermanaeromonas sp. C210]|uniref:UDP-N-acetylglucosamine 1-carboxyvinyltransferase n=1 Tax=Thermanaeromonas sp. C210 TaxID=2731925 RepID=UPI00155B7F53|nr:UDP-N-acetylglucosamine 1-carboxyvinyltransferase [Thermanaeromonas sp. C210]GFN22965.1 UDP-N-acetylglucosamine 1-carboxyvinyltransferase [Thermanaeromonas sp. C210]
MDTIRVRGGARLEGRVAISGAKNAALPIIAACLLAEGECRLEEVPHLADVDTMCGVVRELGLRVLPGRQTLTIINEGITGVAPPYDFVRRMRASFLVLGPLLARAGKVKVALPGGCAIGARPIDLHLKGLAALGAEIEVKNGWVKARARRLRGASIYLDFPSVGATENIMMAAALAEGTTTIENAAGEPEIVDLANFINAMGGRITGAGTRVIRVEGVKQLRGTSHAVIPDRIEAGTFMVAAAATGGDVLVENVIPTHLKAVMAKLREAGAVLEEENGGVRVRAELPPKAVDLKTMPYPGFPTDMQAQFMALLTVAQGSSVITETVFENRFMHVNELKRMGAQIVIEGHCAVVKGVEKLTGACVKATDLRAGAALVIAGLMAEGETEIGCVHHIRRGYEDLVGKLQGLGADITEN